MNATMIEDMNVNSNDIKDEDDTVLNYTYKDVNLAYSHEPIMRDGVSCCRVGG